MPGDAAMQIAAFAFIVTLAGCQTGAQTPPSFATGDDAPETSGTAVTAPLMRVERVEPGEDCAAGGISVHAGVDTDRDGVLGDGEVEDRFFVCHGDPGVDGDKGEPGAAGPEGDSGAEGAAGAKGDDGQHALVRLEPQPPGVACSTGGVQVLSGIDRNENGELDEAEIEHSQVVCHGIDGEGAEGAGQHTLIRFSDVDAGEECAAGGVRIDAGADDDEDGTLADGEVEESVVICNASLCDSPAFHDGGGGACIPVGACLDGFHDGGNGACVPAGECVQGMWDGGDGTCVPQGQCAPNFRPDPFNLVPCVPACEAGEHDGGDGECIPEGECAEGFHDGGDGRCFALGECLGGFWDGGDGTCVPEGQCARRFMNVNGVCVVDDRFLFPFDTHEFTPCGASGRQGPDVGQCRGAYADAQWAEDPEVFGVEGGVQWWTAPQGGLYRIEAWGAQGGVNHVQDPGGQGARMRGDFELGQGELVRIIVGQQGVISPQGNNANGGSGGGGGSFVWTDEAGAPTLLIAAGGGGGSGLRNPGAPHYLGLDGVIGPDGTMARDNQGPGGQAGGDAPNGGGHGWETVRDAPDGVAGGNNYGGPGGFGGGGGGGYGLGGNRQHSAGGGGGYSGGGVCIQNYYAGGGGGSYNDGANPDDEGGANEGHGRVRITLL